MSKNISIQEGSIAKQMTVDRLKTNLVSGGTCLWVPEDEVQLTTKTITENGTYNASDDGYYGYEQVIVSGVGSATGTDGDGDEATVTTGDDGELVTTKIPSSIEVVTPPTVVDYADGDPIDFTGIVVKGYLKTGGLWSDDNHPGGIIPISELLFPVTIASFADAHGQTVESDLNTSPVTQPILESREVEWLKTQQGETFNVGYSWISGAPHACFVREDKTTYSIIVGSETPVTVTHHCEIAGKQPYSSESDVSNSYTYEDKKVYYKKITYGRRGSAEELGNSGFTNPDQNIHHSAIPENLVAWTMVYGDIVTEGGQTIPVQWSRVGDGEILESEFTIQVTM